MGKRRFKNKHLISQSVDWLRDTKHDDPVDEERIPQDNTATELEKHLPQYADEPEEKDAEAPPVPTKPMTAEKKQEQAKGLFAQMAGGF